MASFFRKFILGFADIARPLNDLLKKDADVVRDWTETRDQAMNQLKEKLVSAPVLTHDDGVSQLELHTDASCKGLGAVLYLVKESVRKPIAFASRRLDGPEGKYHINELEFLALLWAGATRVRHLGSARQRSGKFGCRRTIKEPSANKYRSGGRLHWRPHSDQIRPSRIGDHATRR